MWWIIVTGIALAIIIAFVLLMNQMQQMQVTQEKMPYTLNKSILTDREKQFMKILEPAAHELGLTVYPKVRIADIVSVNKGIKERQKWFNKISSKHIDYVLCDEEQNISLLVELDDRTHERADVAKNDQFKNALFGNRLVRFKTMNEDILTALQTAIAMQKI